MLELGGNDPLIVMEDADLDKAAELAVAGATKNSGQRCTAVKRILVVEKVADEFVELAAREGEEAEGRRPDGPGDRRRHGHPRGRGASSFERRVDDAVSEGRQAAARQRPARARSIRRPWSITSPVRLRAGARGDLRPGDPDHPLSERHRRGRSASPTRTAYGLSSGVCTNRLDYITRFINELEVGTVNVWEVPGYRIEMSPFGGIKDSGLGYKEGVVEAMKSFTNVKTYSLPWPA